MTATLPEAIPASASCHRRPPFRIGGMLLIAFAVMHGCHAGGHDLDLEPAIMQSQDDLPEASSHFP